MLRTLLARTALVGIIVGLVANSSDAATRTWSGGGVDANWATPLNWVGGVAPVAGDSLVFDGFGRLTNNNNLAADTSLIGLTFAPTAGAFTLGGNRLTLGGNIVDNTTNLTQTIDLDLLLSGTRNVSVVGQALTLISGDISGGFGLNKTGDGTLTLSGANTFSGPLTINAGTVSVSNDNQLGAAPGSPAAGRLVVNGTTGTLNTTATMTINANRGIALGPSAGSGAGIIRTNTGTTLTYGGVMANNGGGTGGLTKGNQGGLTLFGANTYSGPTAIKNGTVTLDFAAAGAPTNNIINSASSLSLGGENAGLGAVSFSALTMNGAGVANNQSFNGTTLDLGAAVVRANSGTGGTANLSLGAITRNAGSVLNIVPPASGNITTTTANVNGILGGWATVGAGVAHGTNQITMGTDLATRDGSGNIVAYTGYTDFASEAVVHGTVSAATNYRITAATAGGVVTINTDDANTTTDINTITISDEAARQIVVGNGNTLRLGQYGAIFRSAFQTGATNQIGTLQNIGTMTAGGAPNTPGEILFNVNASATAGNSQSAGSINVEVAITDNGTGAVSVIKSGPGPMKLRGHNSYSGGTYILGGRFQAAGSENGGTGNFDAFGTGPVTVVPGGQAFLSGIGDAAVSGTPMPNDFSLAGLGTAQEQVGAIRFGNGAQISGDVTLLGDARLGGGNAATQGTTGITGKISGDFNIDFGALATINTHLMISNPANDWRGTTTLNARNTATQNTFRIGASNVIPNGVGKGNVVMNGNSSTGMIQFDMFGSDETINGLQSTGNVGGIFIENNGFTATIVDPTPGDTTNDDQSYTFAADDSVLTVGDNDQTATFNGIIRNNDAGWSQRLVNPNWEGPTDPELDPQFITVVGQAATSGSKVGVTKIGTGLQVLGGINTYTGATTVNGGVLAVTGALDALGNVTVNSSGTIAGAGDGTTGRVGNVTVNSGGRVAPGSTGSGSVGTLHPSSLAVTSGDVHIDFSGANVDLVNVQGSASFAGASTITPFGTPTAGLYTVIQSTSPITGAGTLTLNPFATIPNTRPASGTLNLSDPNAVKIAVTGGAKSLTWIGNVNNEWDLVGDANWNSGGPDQFFNGDSVTFNNTSTNLNDVQLVGNLEPSSVTVDGTRNYTFAGTGSITGAATLTKQGTGTLTIANSNSYTGTTSIAAGGIVQIGNGGTSGSLGSGEVANEGTLIVNRSDSHTIANVISGTGEFRHVGSGVVTLTGTSTHTGMANIQSGTVKTTNSGSLGAPAMGSVNISNGATLDVGGSDAANNTSFGAKPINVVGTGVGGLGAIINSNTTVDQINAFQLVTLTGNTTFGTYGRFDMRDPAPADTAPVLDLAGHTLTKKGTDHFGIVAGTITDGNIIVEEGIFAIEGASTVSGTGTITFQDNTELRLFGTQGAGTITRSMEFNGSVGVHNNDDAASTFDSPVTMKGAATFTWNNQGANPTTLNGVISEMGGPRGIEAKTLNVGNSLVLTADNTYTGSTSVSGPGTLSLSPLSFASNLADTSIVSVGSDSILNLNYGGTDTIRALVIGGVSLVPGIYGGVGSGFIERPEITGGGTLTVTAKILPGDFNGDNTVDARDYVVWRNNEGTFNTLANDPLFGTEIDADQYNIWRANFGNTLPGSGGGAALPGAVPEPGAVVLALIAMVGPLFLRSRGVCRV